ncbi:MAG: T9SS type A sorting domain-containing protein [Saprospiraceae bacterium]
MKWIIFLLLVNNQIFSQADYDRHFLSGYDVFKGDTISLNDVSFPDYEFQSKGIKGLNMFNATGVTMSNKDGELQFSANGCRVYDASNKVMKNGVLQLEFFEQYITCMGTSYNDPQINSAFPTLAGNDQYYYIHQRFSDFPYDYLLTSYLFKIDMAADNGNGELFGPIDSFNIDTTYLPGHVVVKHADNESWWVVDWRNLSSTYHAQRIGKVGLLEHIIDTCGKAPTLKYVEGWGQHSFNLAGTQYCRYAPNMGVFLYDFDRSAGKFSNFRELPFEADKIYPISSGGVAFSPNGRYLYVGLDKYLYQYDLQSNDIPNSQVFIDSVLNPPHGPILPDMAYLFQGPDCKLYVYSHGGTEFYHVIHYPNNPGLSCQFEQYLELPQYKIGPFPNNPNMRLGTPYEKWCDSLSSSTDRPVMFPRIMHVYPNPAIDEIHLSIPIPGGIAMIYDGLGRLIQQNSLAEGIYAPSIDVANLAPGIYSIIWTKGEEREQCQFVKY